MNKLPNVLKSRHGIYYFRHFQSGREIRLSLRTKDWRVAKLLALQLLVSKSMNPKKFDVLFPNGIQITGINSDDDLDRVSRLFGDENIQYLLSKAQEKQPTGSAFPSEKGSSHSAIHASPKLKTKLISEASILYIEEKRHDNIQKTLNEKQSTIKEFIRLFGDVDTNSVIPETAISYKNKLISDGLSARRINKTISFLKDFFNYCATNRLYFGANPFENLTISSKSKLRQATKSYLEFTTDELKLIFETSKYREFMNKPDYYWLPFLALFTGARIEELASLKISDIKEMDGIWYFNIEKAKNSNSIRLIPLHEIVVKSSFLEFVNTQKSGNGQLFNHIKPTINGYSKNTSRRFSQYLELLKIKNSQKSFHSFRATFINRMTHNNVHPSNLMAIVGHYEQSKLDFSSSHFQTYQQNKPLAILKETIDKLNYPIGLEF